MVHGFYWRPQSSKCGHTQKRSNRQEFLPIEKNQQRSYINCIDKDCFIIYLTLRISMSILVGFWVGSRNCLVVAISANSSASFSSFYSKLNHQYLLLIILSLIIQYKSYFYLLVNRGKNKKQKQTVIGYYDMLARKKHLLVIHKSS